MVKLIIGRKGSGKTKKLIDAVKVATEASNGNVVCIEKGPALTYDIPHKTRLVNIENFGVVGYDAFYGFLCGICAGNYDVTDIFVDATLRIGSRDYNELCEFIKKVKPLSEDSNTVITFTVSCDESELPAEIFDFAERF